MKNLFYLLLIFLLPNISFAGNSEFSYDKSSLTKEFSRLNKVAAFVDETNVSYTELSNTHVFEGSIELTNAIAVKPNIKFEEVDWSSFAWGFCCWPVGIFTVLINDSKDQKSKNSFWAGFGSVTIAYSIVTIAVYAITIASFSSY